MSDLSESEVHAIAQRLGSDPEVRGLILTGSAARGMRSGWSDVDVFVVYDEPGDRRTERSPELDAIVVSLAELRAVPPPPVDDEGWWNRYAFADARVILDRTDGELPGLVRAQAMFTEAEVSATLDGYLDGYLNFAYRSLKSHREGRDLERRLDAVESISWLLWTVFALEGRVRPYQKYLRHELAVRPLSGAFEGLDLVAALEWLMDDGDVATQWDLIDRVSAAAVALGKGDTVAGWDDEFGRLRKDVR